MTGSLFFLSVTGYALAAMLAALAAIKPEYATVESVLRVEG